uniref:Disks large homolog 5-like n=1 Tax=Phallusia mammillata TaxID=59560 RepID=A0A6F9DAG5_9ASCI|nr:disks large homolog 5-like [Phallusia mammillata]
MSTTPSTEESSNLTSGENGDLLSFGEQVYSQNQFQTELAALQQTVQQKEMELADLTVKHQSTLSDRNLIESELKKMQEKVVAADNKLTEFKAETEAFLRQSQSDQQELAMMRRRSLVGGGGQIITQMYETILQRYEQLSSSHEELRRKFAEESESRSKIQKQLENVTMQNPDKESMIRQLELMNERMESLQKDLARVRDERTKYKREYALVMSERDSVHQDMNKLQDDLSEKETELKHSILEKQKFQEELETTKNQLLSLQRGSTSSVDISGLKQELYVAQCERKQALLEKEVQLQEAYNARKAHEIAMETIELTSREKEALRAKLEITKQELIEARSEAEAATRWRKLAFSERDKLGIELEESRKNCDIIKEERERLVKRLEEAVKEHDSTKETKNKILGELREMQTRIELTHNGNTHSHDSAIDAGDWDGLSQDVALRQRRFVRQLPRQRDVTVEMCPFVKNSICDGILNGDRLVAVNNVSVAEKTIYQVNEMLSQNDVCELKLERSFTVHEHVGSHDNMIDQLENGYGLSHKQGRREEWEFDEKSTGDLSPRSNERSPDYKHGNKSDYTSSHPTNKAPVKMRKNKKPSSSRFPWTRKNRNKSSTDTSSTGGSNRGTWPRLDSQSLTNVLAGNGGGGGQGRLSVFTPKPRPRPQINFNTFTPPSGNSAGHTPPTAIRGQPSMTSATPTPDDANFHDHVRVPSSPPSVVSQPVVPIRSSRTHGKGRMKRPQSAPMGPSQSIFYTAVNINNNNIVAPNHWKDTGNTDNTEKSSNRDHPKSIESSHGSRPSVSTSPDIQLPVTPSSERPKFSYNRQQSYPEASSQKSMSSASIVTPQTARSRNAYSLPRPSNGSRTISVSSSHVNRSRTIDMHKRIRMPSDASVGHRPSEIGSITISSDRSTPLLFQPSPDSSAVATGSSRSTSQTDASMSSLSVESGLSTRSRKLPPGTDARYVSMIKGSEPIGISIVKSGDNSGIYVSRVTEHSLAAKAGLEYGDQLLEYNGINLRNAREEQARVIMSQTQTGDNIKILAQYNPEKYKQSIENNLTNTLGVAQPAMRDVPQLIVDEREEGTITPDATPRASPHVEETLRSQRLSEPRYVFLSGGCGHVKLVGGNAYGIYVASVQSNEDTLTPSASDLKVGDRIIEFNSVRFENTTLEGASIMTSQATKSASLCVMYEPNKYKQIYATPGDHFYVRALFDHMSERDNALRFKRNSILLVENTFPDYTIGHWVAWLVDEQGERSTRGRIPSKLAVEKDNSSLVIDDVTSTTGSNSGKRLSGSGRRSFFKRRKPHRTSSRSSGDVHLNKSVSETSIESAAEPGSDHTVAYQVVEKHNSDTRRPVIVFGPHSVGVVERLARDHPSQFVKCSNEQMRSEDHESEIISTRFEMGETLALTGDILRRTMSQFPDRHVLLELSVDAIDRLHKMQIYPIIIFIKYQSSKKIKESQDRLYREKLSGKQCKEIMEKSNIVERKLMSTYYGTVCINGGTSPTVAGKVAKVVSHEHTKVLWLPSNNSPLRY